MEYLESEYLYYTYDVSLVRFYIHFSSFLSMIYACVSSDVQSFSARNKELLRDKKALLIKNKIEADSMEKEKVTRATYKKHPGVHSQY